MRAKTAAIGEGVRIVKLYLLDFAVLVKPRYDLPRFAVRFYHLAPALVHVCHGEIRIGNTSIAQRGVQSISLGGVMTMQAGHAGLVAVVNQYRRDGRVDAASARSSVSSAAKTLG